MPNGMDCPPQVNPQFIWDYEDHFDLGVLANMHEYFQEKIKSSLEYKAKMEPVDVPDVPMPKAEDEPSQLDSFDLQ